MIKGNWSLAADIRKNERKKQSDIQKRQKNQFRLEKLSNIDPIKLFYRIKRLEAGNDNSENGIKTLKSLKDDWSFIEKKGLHKGKLEPFLKNYEIREKSKIKASKKLWGQKSIYFNPELNPLGKVPTLENSTVVLPNLTKPIKTKIVYEADPIIQGLDIVLPAGVPPRFYKLVQNIQKPKEDNGASTTSSVTTKADSETVFEMPPVHDSDSDSDVAESDEEPYSDDDNSAFRSKKRRIN